MSSSHEKRVKVVFDADGNPLNKTVTEIEKTVSGTKKTIEDAGKSAQGVGGVFGKFGADVKSGIAMGFGLGTVQLVQQATRAVIEFAKDSVRVGAEFEQSMAGVQAVTGATGVEFNKLSDFARELGKTTMMSAQESADAMKFLGMAGWETSEIMAGLPAILDLTIASGKDFASVADIVSDNLTAFGMSADQATQYTDALAYAMSHSNVNMDTLGESLKYIAPVAESAGFSMEETVSAVMALGDAGIKGSQAGTTLRTVMLNLTGANQKATDKLNELGVAIFDSEGKTRSFNDIIRDLEGALEGMTDAQKTATLNTIVGKTAVSGFSAILGQGADKLDSYTNGVRNSAGASAEMADVMGNTLQGNMKLFSSAVQELQIKISEGLNPALNFLVQVGTEVVNALNGGTEEATIFGLAVSQMSAQTQQALKPFEDLRNEMNTLMTSTKLMGITTETTFNEMGTIVENWRTRSIENLQGKQNDERAMMQTFFAESLGLEGKALQDRMKQYDEFYALEIDTVNNAMDRILEIKENAKNEKRDLTQQECDEILEIMNNESQRMIELQAISAGEQEAILEAMGKNKANITKDNYMELIEKARGHKDEMISIAEDTMNEQIKQAYRSKEMRIITEDEYNKIVQSAQENFRKVSDEAESAFTKTKNDITDSVTESYDIVNEKTGEILQDWDGLNNQFNRGIKGKVEVEDGATSVLGRIKGLWDNLWGKGKTINLKVNASTKGIKSRAMSVGQPNIPTGTISRHAEMLSEVYPNTNTINYNGDFVFKQKGDIDYFLKQTARAIDRRY